MIYNEFCQDIKCGHYIEWDYSFDADTQPYRCVSCKLVGQSHNIDTIPAACPFIDEIHKLTEEDTR